MTERRLDRLSAYIGEYQKWSNVSSSCCPRLSSPTNWIDIIQEVSKIYNENVNYYKQHFTSHVIDDIRNKGTTKNGSTRPGEGMQQECAEAYAQTNCRQAENQVCDMALS